MNFFSWNNFWFYAFFAMSMLFCVQAFNFWQMLKLNRKLLQQNGEYLDDAINVLIGTDSLLRHMAGKKDPDIADRLTQDSIPVWRPDEDFPLC